jgi:hypothetical protein
MAKHDETELSTPILVIRLERGLADRRRLPLAHVMTVLEEVRQIITEAGRRIQTERGIERASADFGLELVAAPPGSIVRAGSLQAHVAITQDIEIGLLAAQQLVHTVSALQRKAPKAEDEIDHRIVRRLNRIAGVQRTDKTDLRIELHTPNRHKPAMAVFDEAAMSTARSFQAPSFMLEGVTLFGKLFQLKDTDPEEDSERGFWGELRRENGETWRLQFKASDADRVVGMFRRQVSVTGTAFYYRVTSPKLLAHQISIEPERDYETAFDHLYGCDREALGGDFQALLKEMTEE